jgi:hypothetical protein
MNLTDFLERRFGRYAIPGLVRMIVVLNALAFVLGKLNPAFLGLLELNKAAILHGEIWRLVTYIFLPNTDSFLWILLALGFLWMIGDGLEQAWGAFRLNLYYLTGMIGTTVAAFVFGAGFSNTMLNMSLFFAFAWFYPDVQVYVMMILPVKVRWMAWLLGALLLLQLAGGSASLRMATLVSMANYLIFFGPQIYRNVRHRQGVSTRQRAFASASVPEDQALHRCAICSRTERTNPELDFRVGRDGNDYCMEHLPKLAG